MREREEEKKKAQKMEDAKKRTPVEMVGEER